MEGKKKEDVGIPFFFLVCTSEIWQRITGVKNMIDKKKSINAKASKLQRTFFVAGMESNSNETAWNPRKQGPTK